MIFFCFFFAYLLREKRSPVEVVGLFGKVLPAQKWMLLSFVNMVVRRNPLLGKNRCPPPAPSGNGELEGSGRRGAPMLCGVCHLLNGCLGEAFINACLLQDS